jgi:hypothetical protein
MCVFFPSFSGCWVIGNFVIFLKIKVAKQIWEQCCHLMAETGSWFSLIDLLVPTSLDQLLLILQTGFTFYITSYLNEEVNCTELPLQLVFPGCGFGLIFIGATTFGITTLCIIQLMPNEPQHHSKNVMVGIAI